MGKTQSENKKKLLGSKTMIAKTWKINKGLENKLNNKIRSYEKNKKTQKMNIGASTFN